MVNNTDILRSVGSSSKTIGEAIDNIIGDTPVSVQLNTALSQMADKDHVHENYVTREEFYALKQDVETLISLIGDTSVSEQIAMAMSKI